MKRNILTKLFCLTFVALLSFSAYAQEKIYLVKDSKVIATYAIDEVDYLTFDPSGLATTDDFEIILGDVTYTSVEWTVIPKDPNMWYYTSIFTQEAIDNRGSVEGMASTLYEDMSFLAGMMGVPVEEVMETQILHKGEYKAGNYQLAADSEFIIVAFGCTPEGQATTATYTGLTFYTPEMPKVDFSVDFSVECETNEAKVTTTPSDPSIRYYIALEEAGKDFNAQDAINYELWKGSVLGKSEEEVIADITVSGSVTREYSLEPEFEYVLYAFPVTAEGVVNSDVSSKSFVTGNVEMSDNTFDLSVSDITPLSCMLNIVPSNNDFYSIGLLPASDFEGKTDKEVLNRYILENGFTIQYFNSSGQRSYEWTGLDPETEYVFFAFGYYYGVVTTPMSKVTFTTLPASDPKTWEATFSNVEINEEENTAIVTINVNQQDTKYLWNVVQADATPEQIHEALLGECERYEGMGINYVDMRCIWGSNEVSFTPYDETGEFKFFAVVMNPETYEFETEVFFSENFVMSSDAAKMPALKVKQAAEKDAKADEKLVVKNVLKL